jgi:ribonuclease VapC
MAKQYVLDASALLAALFDEPGARVTETVLNSSVISAVNYSEVIAKQMRKGVPLAAAIQVMDDLHLPVVPWDEDLAREASDLSPLVWTHGLSLGDRACLATARRLRRTALTAESAWKKLPNLTVDIKVIR